VKVIERGAFSGCSGLESIELKEGLKRIDAEAFEGCSSLREITIPAGVEKIGSGIFDGCNNLRVVIEVEKMYSAFSGCESLTEVTIPVSVKLIANHAFAHCEKLQDINLLRTKPIEIESVHAFPGEPCRINIPKGSIDSYQFTPKWKKFNYREVRY
jgi:hypothetical protein